MTYSKSKLLLSICIITVTISLLLFPSEILQASKKGMHLWWSIVFPSLLPFFVLSEFLILLGVVHFMGVLLEPFMRPLFKVPGVGGFVFTMAMASGNPSSAKYTLLLRKEGQLSKIEAERLLAFTSFSSPLFIFGAISVGFLQNATVGFILASSHYLSNIFVGLCMRFYKKSETDISYTSNKKKQIFTTAITTMLEKQTKEQRPFGKLFGDAIVNSVQTLLLIGGFIIMFSVLNKTFQLIGIWEAIVFIVSPLLYLFNISPDLIKNLFSGILEITIGSETIGSASHISLYSKCIIISAFLGFGGLSIHSQIASIIASSDISLKPFYIGRILQVLFSIILTALLFKPLYSYATAVDLPAFLQIAPTVTNTPWITAMNIYGPLFTITMIFIASIFLFYKLVFHNK